MSFSLFPKSVQFFDYFQKQHLLVARAASTLSEIFNDFSDVSRKCVSINQLESEGNILAREISRSLSMTFITPIDREDIYTICIEQGGILDLIQDISTRVGLYGFREVPKSARDLVMDLDQIIESQGEMIRFISIRSYDEAPMNRILEACMDGNRLLVVSLGELFERAESGQMDFPTAIKLSQIYDRIEMLLKHVEKFSFTLEKVGIKNA